MLGAIIGDIVGSVYEFSNYKHKDFLLFSPNCFFTDDTIMTVAVAEALRKTKKRGFKNLELQTVMELKRFGKLYPNASYGNSFRLWLGNKNYKPYSSFGNGAAMRVSSVAYYANSLEEVKELSKIVTGVTHNHPEGLKGAEATAVATWLAFKKKSKEEIIEYIKQNYYDLNFDYDDLVKNYYFNETCQNTVPQAIFCFAISKDFEDCLRTSVSIGGDTDTLCAISGAIAEAYYGIPDNIKEQAFKFLDKKIFDCYNDFLKTKI